MELSFVEQFIKLFGEPVRVCSDGSLYFWCPNCHKKSLSCSVIKGLFNCWIGCGLKGQLKGAPSRPIESGINEVIQKQIIQFIWDQAGLSLVHKDYLHKRGIWNPGRYGFKTVPFGLQKMLETKFTRAELESSGIMDYKQGSAKLDWSLSKPRLMIPYISEGQVVGIKMRANEVEFIDPAYKYMWPKGSPVKNLLWHPDKLGPDVIITEGEIAACVGCEYGIPSCGIPGMNSNLGSVRKFNMLCLKEEVRRKFVIIDTDEEMEDRVSNIKNALKIQSVIPDSCIAFLPHDGLVKSVDLDYFLNTYGVDKLYEVLEDAWIQRNIYKQKWTKKLREIEQKQKIHSYSA